MVKEKALYENTVPDKRIGIKPLISRRSRSTAAVKRDFLPEARPLGAVIASMGMVLFLSFVLLDWYPLSSGFKYPGLNGLLAGLLIYFGLLVLYWRFSLSVKVVAVLIVALCGTLVHWDAMLHKRVRFVFFPDHFGYRMLLMRNQGAPNADGFAIAMRRDTESLIREETKLINEGLIGTLRERNVTEGLVDPLHAEMNPYSVLQLELRSHPYVDRRMNVLQKEYRRYQTARMNVFYFRYAEAGSRLENRTEEEHARQAADSWYRSIKTQFGAEHARAVMRNSAEYVKETSLKIAFLERAE